MGAYAVEYITASSHIQRGYYEVAVRISYRRTLEQLQAVVNATSPEALYSLLADALADGRTELAVRMGYWGETGLARLEEAVALLREEQELTETPAWVVNFYPTAEEPGLVEFLLDPPEPSEEEDGALPEDGEAPAPESEAAGPAEAAGLPEDEPVSEDGLTPEDGPTSEDGLTSEDGPTSENGQEPGGEENP